MLSLKESPRSDTICGCPKKQISSAIFGLPPATGAKEQPGKERTNDRTRHLLFGTWIDGQQDDGLWKDYSPSIADGVLGRLRAYL
jgi:hypothetical protein